MRFRLSIAVLFPAAINDHMAAASVLGCNANPAGIDVSCSVSYSQHFLDSVVHAVRSPFLREHGHWRVSVRLAVHSLSRRQRARASGAVGVGTAGVAPHPSRLPRLLYFDQDQIPDDFSPPHPRFC